MISIHICDNKEIDTSDKDFRSKVINSVSKYVTDNFDNVVSCNKEYHDNEDYPYRMFVNIKL